MSVNFWKVWQPFSTSPRLTAKVQVTSATKMFRPESTARPWGAAKLPAAAWSGVPQRVSRRPSRSNTLTRP